MTEINIFTIAWVSFMFLAAFARPIVGLVPYRPKPTYSRHNCRHYLSVAEKDFESDLHRYINLPTQSPSKLLRQLKPDAPFLLQRFWWRIVDSTENSASLVLDYKEDINRGLPPEEYRRQVGMQRFVITLNISWSHNPSRSQLAVTSNWDIENKSNYKSPGALEAVDYTITDLMDFSLGPKGHKALSEKANRFSTLVRRRSATDVEHKFTKTPEHLSLAKRQWPSPQDFNEAMQNPSTAFYEAELKHCKPQLNALGLPQPMTGAFASVYRAETANSPVAIKCFLREVSDQAVRYKMISDFVSNDDLPSTVGFQFIEDGILTGGERFPVLKMQWVNGFSIQDYIDQYRYDAAAMENLAAEFLYMMADLRRAGIAHGDLQHGNIMICPDGLRLVDYDGMFVPGMEGMMSNELGHRNYQHPQRNAQHFGPDLDNFSAWLIYVSVRSIAIDPELWSLPHCGDEHLLFRQPDFLDPNSSETFRVFRSHANPEIREYGRLLEQLCAMPVDKIPPLVLAESSHVSEEDDGFVIHFSPVPGKQPTV